ncbi:hypothetical protein [Corallococcus sp. RDP092CA]|uniref:hypothetical protein n=1 Tax=Corallococcus sp. RDP092CA TaxID=3109369 RepID=UPI0035B2DB86
MPNDLNPLHPNDPRPPREEARLHLTGEPSGDSPQRTEPAWALALERRLATFVAVLVVTTAIGSIPQVSNILLQLPRKTSFQTGPLTALAFWAYVLLLGAFFLFGALWLFVPTKGLPRLMRGNGRLSRGARRVREGLIRLARLPLAVPGEGREGLRRVIYSALALAGCALAALNVLGKLPSSWAEGDPGPYLVAFLCCIVALTGFFGPKLLRRWEIPTEMITRASVMSLGSYVTSEILWGGVIPSIPEASYRLYTIWAIYHLFFVLICVARAIDRVENLTRRAAFTLALVVLTLCVTRFSKQHEALDLEVAPSESPHQERILGQWLKTANARLDRMCKGPVLLVSAAGGGSRAAIFAMLALESLHRNPLAGAGDSRPECQDDRLSKHILMVSSVSGGSVASAHFAHRMAEGTVGATLASEGLLKHAPYSELATQLKNDCGFDNPWPLKSASIDDMFVDFNAPLLRGVVMPGVGRGSSLAAFWKDYFGWPKALPVDGTVPILLLNTASVQTGERVVTGKPPLPELLVSNEGQGERARVHSMSSLSRTTDIVLADAVRASANFPWVVDLPEVETQAEPEVLIDGGIFDNTGIDTFALLFKALANPERWKDHQPDIQKNIDALFTKLAERGVIFVEIDSGAKPQQGKLQASLLSPITTPVTVYSLATNAFARNMSELQKQQIGLILGEKGVSMERVSYDYGDAVLPMEADAWLTQCLQKMQDEVPVMTAWALGPADKGRLLGIFLAQEEIANAIVMRHFKNMTGAALTKDSLKTRSVEGLVGASRSVGFSAEAFELARRVIDDQVSLQKELGSRLYEQSAPSVQSVVTPDTRASEAVAKVGTGASAAWVYIGQYLNDSKQWRTRYYLGEGAAGRELDPKGLNQRVLVSTTPSFIREEPPAPQTAQLGRPIGALKAGQRVTVVETKDWGDLGFIWAKVRVERSKPGVPGNR